MNVAVGGTNGWFPDEVGGKPWLNGDTGAYMFFVFLTSFMSRFLLFVVWIADGGTVYSGDAAIRVSAGSMGRDLAQARVVG